MIWTVILNGNLLLLVFAKLLSYTLLLLIQICSQLYQCTLVWAYFGNLALIQVISPVLGLAESRLLVPIVILIICVTHASLSQYCRQVAIPVCYAQIWHHLQIGLQPPIRSHSTVITKRDRSMVLRIFFSRGNVSWVNWNFLLDNQHIKGCIIN